MCRMSHKEDLVVSFGRLENVSCPLCGYAPPDMTVTDRVTFSCPGCEHVWVEDPDDGPRREEPERASESMTKAEHFGA